MTDQTDVIQEAWEFAIARAPIKLIRCVEYAFSLRDPDASPLQVAERADTSGHGFRREFDRRMEGYLERRLLSPLRWSERDPDRLLLDIPQSRSIPGILRYIRNRISGSEFEHLCASLLRKAGCSQVFVTQRTGDEGIDVIAHMETPPADERLQRLMRNLTGGPDTILVAQCKKHEKHRVGVEKLREFIGATYATFQLAQQSTPPRGARRLRELGWKPKSSTVLAFFTTSQYTADAARLADELGIILIDGEGIVQGLIESEVVKLVGGEFGGENLDAIRQLSKEIVNV